MASNFMLFGIIVTPPSNVIVAMVTSTSAMIQWEEPSPLATNGSTLRRYDILWVVVVIIIIPVIALLFCCYAYY